MASRYTEELSHGMAQGPASAAPSAPPQQSERAGVAQQQGQPAQQQQQAFHFPPPDAQFPYAYTPRMGPNYDPRLKGSFTQGTSGGGGYPPTGYTSLPFYRSGVWDAEAASWAEYAGLFAEQRVRQAFVRKVLAIVFVQLLVTALASAAFYLYQPLKELVHSQVWPFWALWGLSFVLILVLGFSQTARRRYPWNMITLVMFTLSFALLVGIVTSFYDIPVLLMALGITAATVLFIYVLATATTFDFTKAGGFLYVAGFVFMVAIIVGVFVRSNVYYLIISVIGALLFSAYLLFDLQLIMGGRMLELSPDDATFAAVQIYLDVVTMFLQTLQVLDSIGNN